MNSCFSSFFPYQSVPCGSKFNAAPTIVRAAQTKDLRAMAEILTDSFHPPQGTIGWLNPLLKLGIYEDLRSRLHAKSSQYLCLVASIPSGDRSDRQEDIVGTVEVSVRSHFSWSIANLNLTYPYVSNLAVKDSYRRQGIARKLLLSCERTASEWGFKQISLHVLENNDRARQLYFSSGYQLQQVEYTLGEWLFNRSRRLLLNKEISRTHQTRGSIKSSDYAGKQNRFI